MEQDRTCYCSPLSKQLAIVVFFLLLFFFSLPCVCTFLRWCNRSFFFSPIPFFLFFTFSVSLFFSLLFPSMQTRKYSMKNKCKAFFCSLAVYLLVFFYCEQQIGIDIYSFDQFYLRFVSLLRSHPPPKKKRICMMKFFRLKFSSFLWNADGPISPIERNKKEFPMKRGVPRKKGYRKTRLWKLMNFSMAQFPTVGYINSLNANCRPIKFSRRIAASAKV